MFMELINIMDILEETRNNKKYPLWIRKLIIDFQVKRVKRKFEIFLRDSYLTIDEIIEFIRFYNETVNIVDDSFNYNKLPCRIKKTTKIAPHGLYLDLIDYEVGYSIFMDNDNKDELEVWYGGDNNFSYNYIEPTDKFLSTNKTFIYMLNRIIRKYINYYISARLLISTQ